jgi:hypothetical protein
LRRRQDYQKSEKQKAPPPRPANAGQNNKDPAGNADDKQKQKAPPDHSSGASFCDGGLSDFFFLPLADLAASYSPAA